MAGKKKPKHMTLKQTVCNYPRWLLVEIARYQRKHRAEHGVNITRTAMQVRALCETFGFREPGK